MINWSRVLLPVTAVALALLAACGSAPASPPSPVTTDPHAGMDMSGGSHDGMDMNGMQGMDMGGGGLELWAVQTGPLGVVVTDGSGALIYRSDRDGNAPSVTNCTDACTATWQPVVEDADQPPSLLGVDETAIGTVARSDGTKQVTLAGWPLYRHVGDKSGLGDTGANGADGVWFAIKPDGGKATPPTP
jgi:predicted lipoprotein with Yx(FWY)xxD motif